MESVLASILGAIISAFFGGLINKIFFSDNSILPIKFKPKKTINNPYGNIKYEYRLDYSVKNSTEAIWIRSDIQLEFDKKKILKGWLNKYHGSSVIRKYLARGEVREGHLLLNFTYVNDSTKFFTALYTILASENYLPGILVDFEDKSSIAAVSILSPEILNPEQLLSIVKLQDFNQLIHNENIKSDELLFYSEYQ